MTTYSKYYENNLYPFQDGVLNIVEKSNTHFYLTGGTALSRGYYNHRYSDDLDFFVNDDESFHEQVSTILSNLKVNGFFWNTEKDFFKSESFYSLHLHQNNSPVILKVDFVNDIKTHFGQIQATKLFTKTDSIQNILSNKITALFRYEGKDVADIREIALHNSFNWTQIICEAREKEAGLESPVLAEILQGMPIEEFKYIKWTKDFEDWKLFQQDINIIVTDLLSDSNNSLFTK